MARPKPSIPPVIIRAVIPLPLRDKLNLLLADPTGRRTVRYGSISALIVRLLHQWVIDQELASSEPEKEALDDLLQ